MKSAWKKCPACQARIAKLHLNDENHLQSDVIARIDSIARMFGKRSIGWDEILQGGAPPSAAVMAWQSVEKGREALRVGHDVVMAPISHLYLDQAQSAYGEPVTTGGVCALDSLLAFDPYPETIADTGRGRIIGAEATLWTEHIADQRTAEYMMFPRLIAFAEAVWSPRSQRDAADFLMRLDTHYDRLRARDTHFRIPPPIGLGGRRVFSGDTTVALRSGYSNATLRYTLNGEAPDASSSLYTSPIKMYDDLILTVRSFAPDGRASNAVATEFLRSYRDRADVSYAYYEGSWPSLPNFESLSPARTGRTNDLSLDAIAHRTDRFAVAFATVLRITNEGMYTFTLASDDGSRLFLDEALLIEHDGIHGLSEKTASVFLARGLHPLRVEYFDYNGRELLNVTIEGPSLEKQSIHPLMCTRMPLALPRLVSPASEEKVYDTLRVEWLPVASAARYRMQVAAERSFTEKIIDETTTKATTMWFTGLSPQKRFYCRVRAESDFGESEWTEPRPFFFTQARREAYYPPSPYRFISYPNPTADATTLTFELPFREHVTLDLFDMLGRKVRSVIDAELRSGIQTMSMNTADLPSGLYRCVLTTTQSRAQRMVVVRR